MLQQLADDFCQRSNLSPASRTWYRDMLARFLPWAAAQGCSRPEDLTPDIVDAYARELTRIRTRRGTLLAPASRKAYLKGLQEWLKWLARRHHVEEVDASLVQLPRLRKRDREVLSRQECQQLEDAAPIERDKLLIRIMADTGAREGEVASMHVDDLVEREGRYHFVRIRGKTGLRLPPVRPELYRRLRAYAAGKTGRPRTSSRFLFMARRRRNGGDYEPLTEDGVYQAVKDAVARAELGRRVYPHLLRGSAITWMISKGMHPALISEITGVSVQVIMAHYSYPTAEQRHEAMARLWD